MSRVVFVTGLLLLLSVGSLHAQNRDTTRAEAVRGTVSLVDWPESLPQLLREMGARAPYLLPEVDSLGVDYRYAPTDSTSRWSFVLGWRPGRRVLYEGDIRPRREGPQGIRMVNVELRADVLSRGEPVGEMIVAVDSMVLRPLPSVYSFEVAVGHDRVFLNVPADEARRALQRGVQLRNLVVERMGFSAPEASRSSARPERVPDARREGPAPRPPSVYTPRTSILVGWRIGPRPYYVDGDVGDGRTVRPRGEPTGQSTGDDEGRVETGGDTGARDGETGARTGRDGGGEQKGEGRTSGASSGDSRTDDKDDDDDPSDLRGPALVAAGAVAFTAVVGGTVGVYGTGETPLGLAAGYTHPKGGVQLQAAVNTAVFEDAPDQRLTAKALGFYDVFDAPVQPALGLGVQVDARRDPEVRPAVSAGLVGNLGRVVLYGGVDLVQGAPEVGLAYNFRFRSADAESDD